ncbi:uncharacterized protein [Montipora foliosa]|uniref:uncharacterized protein n=1 Tax=Montipora foliosa TaxID=591990 RepID=UPI0035F130C7
MAQSEIETLGVVKLADPTRSIENKRALSLMEKTTFKSVNEDAFVINPKKPDRLRRVYDASAKFMGQSLNDKICTGPDLLSSLFGVFLRFCEGRIAMAADVKEMYHMLRLPDRDKPALRFLWRDSLIEEPRVYHFERTVFGEVSAPSRANYTMRRNADENGEDLPLGVKAVYQHFYMDDGLP